jgi:hypothetical protein
MYLSNMGTGEQSPEPFRTFAGKYHDAGLSVFPCGGDDGKKPLVMWAALQRRRIGGKTLDKWIKTHPSANIGIVTGKLSNLTVVDCDNTHTTPMELFEAYGETPLVVRTPSGGKHLYYRYNGEGCSQDAEQRIDIRGEGGFVVAPPSYNRTTREPYRFVIGDLWDVSSLLAMKKYNDIQRKYTEGERNTALFNHLLIEAKHIRNLTVFMKCAETYNLENLHPPLDIKDVTRTANSVWHYKTKGTLYSKGEQFITLPMKYLESIMYAHPKAVVLYIDLIACHKGVNQTLAISAKGYAKRCGWSDKTVRQEIQTLLNYGLIKRVYKGGKFKGDVSLYSF